MKDLFDYLDGEDERCGFVLHDGTIVELENIHPEPTEGFEIDPEDILRYINQIEAIWHTHPGAGSVLSGEDKLCMEIWPHLKHIVVGVDGMSVYIVEQGVVLNEDYIPREAS